MLSNSEMLGSCRDSSNSGQLGKQPDFDHVFASGAHHLIFPTSLTTALFLLTFIDSLYFCTNREKRTGGGRNQQENHHVLERTFVKGIQVLTLGLLSIQY